MEWYFGVLATAQLKFADHWRTWIVRNIFRGCFNGSCKDTVTSMDNFLGDQNLSWLVVWLPFFIFPYIGFLIIPIDGPYFSEGWPNHQPAENDSKKSCHLIILIIIFPSKGKVWSMKWYEKHLASSSLGHFLHQPVKRPPELVIPVLGCFKLKTMVPWILVILYIR